LAARNGDVWWLRCEIWSAVEIELRERPEIFWVVEGIFSSGCD